jgi:hypothetical protein
MSLEAKLIFALGLSFALIVGALTVSKIVLPAFAKIDATFEAARS